MTISKELFLSILAMDGYNRGYDQGITGLSDAIGTHLGDASISREHISDAAQSAGFYAIAYNWNGQTVIAYRGTDDPYLVDIANGYTIGAGVPGGPQSIMATDFYKAVAGGPRSPPLGANILLTGHSMGAGIAGYVASSRQEFAA